MHPSAIILVAGLVVGFLGRFLDGLVAMRLQGGNPSDAATLRQNNVRLWSAWSPASKSVLRQLQQTNPGSYLLAMHKVAKAGMTAGSIVAVAGGIALFVLVAH